MNKALKNFDKRSRFERDLIELILKANDINLEKIREIYPELVKEFRGEMKEAEEPHSITERKLIRELKKDKTIKSWTTNHKIVIPYNDEDGVLRGYKPDFLIERIDGTKEIIDLFAKDMGFEKRTEGSKKWCKSKGIKFRIINY